MPYTQSADDLDDLIPASVNLDDDEYESVLDDPDFSDPQAQPQPTPQSSPELVSYLAEESRLRREEIARKEAAERQEAAARLEQQAEARRAERIRALNDRLDRIFVQPEELNFSPDQREALASVLPALERTAQHYSQAAVGNLREAFSEVMQRNMELEDNLERVRQSAAPNPQAQVDLLVRAQIPDIDNLVNDPDWKSYRDTQIPGAGFTPAQAIHFHHQNGNVNGIVEILKTFRGRSKTRRYDTVSPGIPSPSPSQGAQRRGRKLRVSELEKAYEKADQGLLSRDKLQSIVDRFENAAAAGLVDYNS